MNWQKSKEKERARESALQQQKSNKKRINLISQLNPKQKSTIISYSKKLFKQVYLFLCFAINWIKKTKFNCIVSYLNIYLNKYFIVVCT